MTTIRMHTSNLHLDILDEPQKAVLWSCGKSDFTADIGAFLGGGTAIALQLGHRRSYDLDFFTGRALPEDSFRRLATTLEHGYPGKSPHLRQLVNNPDELTVVVDTAVRLTLISYPFPPLHEPLVMADLGFRMFDLRDLASNKAYTIERRGRWRDYLDLYALFLTEQIDLPGLIEEANYRFGSHFDERLFLQQLQYVEDIEDWHISFRPGWSVEPQTVLEFFEEIISSYVHTHSDR